MKCKTALRHLTHADAVPSGSETESADFMFNMWHAINTIRSMYIYIYNMIEFSHAKDRALACAELRQCESCLAPRGDRGLSDGFGCSVVPERTKIRIRTRALRVYRAWSLCIP